MATAAIKWSAEVACKLCRNAAVKTKGQWLKANLHTQNPRVGGEGRHS